MLYGFVSLTQRMKVLICCGYVPRHAVRLKFIVAICACDYYRYITEVVVYATIEGDSFVCDH